MKTLVIAGILAAATQAKANQCNEYQPQPAQYQIEVGCPITVFVHPEVSIYEPAVRIHRAGEDVTPAVTDTEIEPRTIDVMTNYVGPAPACEWLYGHESVDYRRHVLSIDGLQAGDELYVEGHQLAVLAEGNCTPPSDPFFQCAEPIQTQDMCLANSADDNDPRPVDEPIDDAPIGYCSAGGSPSSLLLLAALIPWARRSSRRGSRRG